MYMGLHIDDAMEIPNPGGLSVVELLRQHLVNSLGLGWLFARPSKEKDNEQNESTGVSWAGHSRPAHPYHVE
jgi:hypothetical protein